MAKDSNSTKPAKGFTIDLPEGVKKSLPRDFDFGAIGVGAGLQRDTPHALYVSAPPLRENFVPKSKCTLPELSGFSE